MVYPRLIQENGLAYADFGWLKRVVAYSTIPAQAACFGPISELPLPDWNSAYECTFCGTRYRGDFEMTSCHVCGGQTVLLADAQPK